MPSDLPTVDRQLPERQQDGVVQIPEASRQFIGVETVGADGNGALLNAPARVAFRDGAFSQLGAPLAGRVVRVDIRTGDTVKSGDPLVTLDCPEAASVRAAVATATAALREARTALDRERRMFKEGVGTQRDRLAAETKVSELTAELTRAQAGAAFVGPGDGTTVVLRAPMTGTVISRKATAGMAVQQGADPIVEIGDPAALWVVAEVFERDLPLIRDGAHAVVELPSVRRPVDGRVASVGAVVTSTMRTAPVRITLNGDDVALRPGMFGRVRIESSEAGMALPTEAVLIKNGKESIVYVERDPLTFIRRAVVVAQPVEGRVQVISGIAPGENVVVRGALLLDGSADQLI